MKVEDYPEHALARSLVSGKRAKRSGTPYWVHVQEGLEVMRAREASMDARRAFCLHVLVQGDRDLEENLDAMAGLDGRVVALALEYRRVANSYLSHHPVRHWDDLDPGPLREVWEMLLADKVQNMAEFERCHSRTHPRAAHLRAYFETWIHALERALAGH